MPSTIPKLALFLATVLTCACGSNQAVQPIHPAIVEITQHENPTQFVGEGRLSHPADFIEFTVSVQSECYPTTSAASLASDRSSKKVVAALREFVDAGQSKDGVFSAPFSRYVNSQLSVCQNTFQKTVSITLKTSQVESLSKGFDGIQNWYLSPVQRHHHSRAAMRRGLPTPRSKHRRHGFTMRPGSNWSNWSNKPWRTSWTTRARNSNRRKKWPAVSVDTKSCALSSPARAPDVRLPTDAHSQAPPATPSRSMQYGATSY